MRGQIGGDEREGVRRAGPKDQDEMAMGGICRPGGAGRDELCRTAPNAAARQGGEQLVIQGNHFRHGRFGGAPGQLHRGVIPRAGELSLVQQAQAGQAQHRERRRPMGRQGQRPGHAQFIVVFQKVRAGGHVFRRALQ